MAPSDNVVLVSRGPGNVIRSPRRKPIHDLEPLDELAPLDFGAADETDVASCSQVIAELWQAATHSSDCLDLSRYLTLHNALFRALRFEFSCEDAQQVALTDFKADSEGHSTVSPQRFDDMLRSLAKGWTTSNDSNSANCALFLTNLKAAIVAPARPPASGPYIRPWQYIEPAAGIRWLGVPTPAKPVRRTVIRRSALTAALRGPEPAPAATVAEEPRQAAVPMQRPPLRHAVRAYGSAPNIGDSLRRFAILNVARRFDAAAVQPARYAKDDAALQASTYPPPGGKAPALAPLGDATSPLPSPRPSEAPAFPARPARVSSSYP